LASRAREGCGGFAGGGFLFRDYQIGDGSELLRGEVGGRRQSRPGSIDGGVVSSFTLIARHSRAREALMMAGAGGATRARGWRATAIRFQQFGEEGSYGIAR
jgi:hypothetical protein